MKKNWDQFINLILFLSNIDVFKTSKSETNLKLKNNIMEEQRERGGKEGDKWRMKKRSGRVR